VGGAVKGNSLKRRGESGRRGTEPGREGNQREQRRKVWLKGSRDTTLTSDHRHKDRELITAAEIFKIRGADESKKLGRHLSEKKKERLDRDEKGDESKKRRGET